ncbi:methylenetetrahydrofolate reductase C-terminal domain-containing protein [Marisediminicola senii]|uniref:methylenetetrahydrofolate reductase C-terminal domain-containing protein n=1 Tax=Marisediminicola senii TaxID=2711233 RepID=UPI00191335FC|nr:methylenetetrahydrofolate reductase C-terminal domain-containing protein [Marisediminicola senii]
MTVLPGVGECPKRMVYGPCGGVQPDGACEASPDPCVFLPLPTVRWTGVIDGRDSPMDAAAPGTPADTVTATGAARTTPRAAPPTAAGTDAAASTPTPADRMRTLLARGRVVVADFAATALDSGSIRDTAAVLRGSVHAVLAGDSPRNRVQFSPSYRAALIRDAGLEPWAGLTCRDRNRVALEAELAGLLDVGVAGVHCVTGDHTALGSRADAQPVFDLDSTRLAALAADAGHLVSVAESPASVPVDRRADRLAEKARAGAEVCFVNHCGGAGAVAAFIARVGGLSARPLRYIPCVPVVVDTGSAELLRSFTSLVLPDGYLDRILSATNPRAEGIAAAVELSEQLLAIDGVAGVNLSGGAALGRDREFAEAMAEIGTRLGVV